MNRRFFCKAAGLGIGAAMVSGCMKSIWGGKSNPRPNILFCIADDWGWPHAGAYGDTVISTPVFDKIAGEGLLFEHAYVTSPSCTPSRNSILTGQYHWRLNEGASLWSTLDIKFPVFPLLLQDNGYQVGYYRKIWGPGDLTAGGYINTHPAGKNYSKGFGEFLDTRPDDKPFCFFLGSPDPHRPYTRGQGKASGIDISKVRVPGFLPNVKEVQGDIADYYFAVQRFDSDCGNAINLLQTHGLLEDTIVIITGDNGMPFPRCKSNVYEMGVHVPLAVRIGRNLSTRLKTGRTIHDFVSLADFAPTFLEMAGLSVPEQMTGKSLCPIFYSSASGQIDPVRDHVVVGKERHTLAQESPGTNGYPCRAIRTADYLYIRNYKPERWPAGTPENPTVNPNGSFTDCDNGPAKAFILANRNQSEYKMYYTLSFEKRPAEELYDMRNDPFQLVNKADDASYQKIKADLSAKLHSVLLTSDDPRASGTGDVFDQYPSRRQH